MPQRNSQTFLVNAKLNQPRVAAQLIERRRLYAALDLHRPLTIVVAPAGYGKTTLVSRWAAQSGLQCAWLSLDRSDSKLSVFVDYFLAAIERLFPDVVRKIAVGPNRGIATACHAAARKLADGLDAVDDSFVVVLDDYQFIDEPEIHRFLAELLRFPPRGLNLVIASRVDPPLPLPTMRARAQLAEIRTRDLRFTLDEVADYLRQELDAVVDDHTLAIVEQSTEGWIAGLHLAALFLHDEKDTAGAVAQFRGSNRFTVDYLAIEVLAKQAEEIQSFLIKTSILQRMCPALCDAILAADSNTEPAAQQSRRILDYLHSHNLFVTTLDDNRLWYRYHHLFQQLLHSRLRATHSKEAISALYRRASHWCAEQNLVDEAVAYAIGAGDAAAAIALIESHRHPAMNAGKWQQLDRWLNLLQRQHIDAHPQMVVLEAWILHKQERLLEVPARLDLAEALLEEGRLPEAVQQRLCSEIDALRSQQYFNEPDATRAYLSAQRTLEFAPPEYASVRGLAWISLGAGLFLTSGLQVALDALASAPSNSQQAYSSEHAHILAVKCFLFWMAADLPNLKQTANELLRYAKQRDLEESVVWAHYFLGCACYQQNDLPAARESFRAVMDRQHVGPSFALIHGAFGLALVLQAQEDPDAAGAAVATVLEYAELSNNIVARQVAQAFEGYLALLQGRLDAAFGWLAGAGHSFKPAPMTGFFAQPVATAAILLQNRTQTFLHKADQMLGNMETYLAASHIDLFYIHVLALHSLLYAACGQHAKALEALEHAVRLAQPGNVQRAFLDVGPALNDLLAQLNLAGPYGDFVRQLCTGNASAGSLAQTTVSANQPQPSGNVNPFLSSSLRKQPRHPDLIELLTNRELEILQLLALRLTNKEIAGALNISTGTVKQHTINLFRKLHVENRRQAIVQARAMGFQIEMPYPV